MISTISLTLHKNKDIEINVKNMNFLTGLLTINISSNLPSQAYPKCREAVSSRTAGVINWYNTYIGQFTLFQIDFKKIEINLK